MTARTILNAWVAVLGAGICGTHLGCGPSSSSIAVGAWGEQSVSSSQQDIERQHPVVASLAPRDSVATYRSGGTDVPFETQMSCVQDALALCIARVPYAKDAASAQQVAKVVQSVIKDRGIDSQRLYTQVARTVMTWWYAYHCDTSRTTYPELARENIDTPAKRRAWSGRQVPPQGTCIDHSYNLERHFATAGLMPSKGGIARAHSRPIWLPDRSVNRSPLLASQADNHTAVWLVSESDDGSSRVCLFDPYWLAPFVKTRIRPGTVIAFKNHYWSGANGFTDPWAQVLKGIAASTHYPLARSEHDVRSKEAYTVSLSEEIIVPFRCQRSEAEWMKLDMKPIADAVLAYNKSRP